MWEPLELSSGDTCRSFFLFYSVFGSCLTLLKRHNFVAMIT